MGKKVKRAGVLPYHIEEDGKIEIMFMKPSNKKYGGDQFQLAKGKVDPGEDIEKAAFREAREELGLFIGNCKDIHKLGVFLGYTTVFTCEVEDKDMFGDPSTPDEVDAVKWMTPEKFQKKGRDIHKPLVKAAVRHIEKKLK